MAAGVSAGYPPFISSADSSLSIPALKNRTIDVWWTAKEAMLSRSGTGVLPAIRVMITLWEIPGSVYSIPKEDAAPQKELTPGQIS